MYEYILGGDVNLMGVCSWIRCCDHCVPSRGSGGMPPGIFLNSKVLLGVFWCNLVNRHVSFDIKYKWHCKNWGKSKLKNLGG